MYQVAGLQMVESVSLDPNSLSCNHKEELDTLGPTNKSYIIITVNYLFISTFSKNPGLIPFLSSSSNSKMLYSFGGTKVQDIVSYMHIPNENISTYNSFVCK